MRVREMNKRIYMNIIRYAFLKKVALIIDMYINYWHVYRLIGLPPSKGDLYIYIVVRGKQVEMEGLLP